MSTPPTSNRDERLGLISASGYETDAMCLGRQNKIKTLPPEAFQVVVEETTDRGLAIHAARETRDDSNLDEEDRENYQRGLKCELEAFNRWMDDSNLADATPGEILEERLYLYWPGNMKPATSGRLDVSFISGRHGCICEWKTMFNSNLTPAERNHQGRLQAVLLAKEYDLTHVRVCFIKSMYGQSDIVDYGPDDLKQAEASIFNTLWQTTQPEAPRSAGNHCRHCVCKPYCAEAQAWALLPSVIAARQTSYVETRLSPAKPEELVARLSLLDCAMLQSRASVIVKVLDEVKSRLKKLPEDQLAELGYGLKDGKKLSTITNPSAMFQELSDTLKLPIESVWKAVKFNKGETVEQFMLEFGWSSKQASEYFDQCVAKYGEVNVGDKSLEKL